MPRKQISYDPVDMALDQVKLEQKYADSGSHPEFTLAKWKEKLSKFPELEAQFNGYWDWVVTMIDADAQDQPEAGHAMQVSMGDEDLIDINDIDQFAGMVGQWHTNKIAVLRHMQSIPAGTEMEVSIGEETRTIKLEGDALFGFRAGLELALIEVGNLPFIATTDADEEPAVPHLKLVQQDAADSAQS